MFRPRQKQGKDPCGGGDGSGHKVCVAEAAGAFCDDTGQGRADGLAGGKEDRNRGKGAGGAV